MSTSSQPSLSDSAARLPSGTVTFLFTDIEGSTQRWDRDRPAMEAAVRAHDRLMRDAIAAHDGAVFKTIGDAFCAVFSRAEHGAAAALEAQRALLAYDFSTVGGLNVRMALHTGTADEREGDYFGSTVNRVARLLAIGHGGQVLFSGVTADLVTGELPARVTLKDLGQQRLKDLANPEWVYQLVAPELPGEFPPLRSLAVLPNNLPLQLTSFVGREKEVAEVAELVGRHRLVTLVGTGGIGKTRISLQVGADLLDGSGDGVWFIELAPIKDGGLIPGVVASALGYELVAEKEPLTALVAALRVKRLLIVFDNCEHVVDDAARVIDALLRGCPGIRILASSRQGLGIAGEETYRIPSLDVPTQRDVSSLTAYDAQAYGSIRLFAERALSADKRFAITDDNAPHIAEIVARLDGIALAIELAAARVSVLSVKALAQRLDERFRILTGGSRTALPRQQTMRALIDWSYELLSEQERALFRKLAIFAGGFTIELATEVCSDDTVADFEIFDFLTSLVDKSLVQVELIGDDSRYRLLESTRQYAREKLAQSGELPIAAQAHARACVSLASRLEARWPTTPDRTWRTAAEPELENLRAALDWAFGERGDVTAGQTLAAALSRVWLNFNAVAEGLRRTLRAIESVDERTPVALHAKLHVTAGFLQDRSISNRATVSSAERALRLLEGTESTALHAEAQFLIGSAEALTNPSRALESLNLALTEFRSHRMDKFTALTLNRMANSHTGSKNFSIAESLYGEALEIYRSTGSEGGIATVANNLGELTFAMGKVERALGYAYEALGSDRSRGDRLNIAADLNNISAYLTHVGRWDEAQSCVAECACISIESSHEALTIFAAQHAAAVFGLRDDDRRNREKAARLLGYVEARVREADVSREFTEQQEYERLTVALADLPPSLFAEGERWNEERVLAEILSDEKPAP